MGFFAPWFLAGALAVGLPLWVHLLKRSKTDPKLFPSLMFFEQREISSVRHRRLEHLLLLALRLALILLLALLFSNPFIRRSADAANGKKITVIAVDRSFSMRTEDRLNTAKTQALSVISGLKPGDQAQVIALAGNVQAMTQVVSDPAELRGAVTAITAGDSRASYGELARYLRTLMEGQKTPLEVHFIGDMQKSGMPPGFADLRVDPGTAMIFHAVAGTGDKAKPVQNWTLENVVAPRRVYDPKRVRMQATVAGFGTPKATRTISLVLNGRTLQTKSVEVPENGRAQVEFDGLDAPYGFSKGEMKIDAADKLPADDSYIFAVERSDPRKVLFVDEGRRPRAELYFRAALDSAGDGGFVVETLRPEVAIGSTLSNYAFVVLSDPGTIPQALDTNLQRYVNGGGSLFIALGPAAVSLPKVPVLDEPIQSSNYADRQGERFLTVTDIDTGNPALRSVDRFNAVKFYQSVKVNPSKSRVLAKLNDGSPLVLERSIGEGKVFVFASTFDNVSNDLPIHAAWVPFIGQTALYLGGGGAEQPVNVPVDSYVELRTADAVKDKAASGAAAEVLDPEGKRVLSLEEAVKATNFQVNREGFFEIKTAGGRRSLVAAHADRRESNLAAMDQETLDLWKGTGVAETTPQAAAAGGTANNEKPWSLWPYLLLLLLGIAVAESVVANGYLRPTIQEREAMKREAA